MTQEIKAWTILSSQRESSIEAGWNELDAFPWLPFISLLDVKTSLLLFFRDKPIWSIGLSKLPDKHVHLTNLERFPRALTAFDFI